MQRKQLHKTVQGTEAKSTKPSASPSPPKEATKQQNKNKEQQKVEEKLEKLCLDDTQETIPTTQSPEPSDKSTSVNKSLQLQEIENGYKVTARTLVALKMLNSQLQLQVKT